MGIYTKLPEELNEVDVIVAGGTQLGLTTQWGISNNIVRWLSRLRRRWSSRRS
jgi:hypothetical protein